MRKIILGGLFLTFLAGCGKDYTPGPIPSERNHLQGSFEYEINGELIEAHAKFVSNVKDDETEIRTLSISGETFSDDRKAIRSDILSLVVNYYDGTKTYVPGVDHLAGNLILGSSLYEPYDVADLKNYYLVPMGFDPEDEEWDGKSEFITVESDGGRYKGTFEFSVVYTNPSNQSVKDTIHISNGRFDIPFD